MMTILSMLMLVFLIKAIMANNPVKTSISMIILSSFMLFQTGELTGSNWMPMIIFLLFTGGILVMFMILSSLMPNEPAKKSKKCMIYIVIPLTLTSTVMPWETGNSFKLKWMMESGSYLSLMMVMITLYFLGFILILEKISNSMKSNF